MPKVKTGLEIVYKDVEGNWIEADVISRSGKATGKYKDNWNVEHLADKVIVDLDFQKIDDWKVRGDVSEQVMDTLMCQTSDVYLSELNKDVEEAKLKELLNWSNEQVYEEIDDIGQETMSVRWVVTPKMIDGKWGTKARLVARGFEEDCSKIRADSPTCMRETVRILLTIASSKNWN